jgi:hypothetical protein
VYARGHSKGGATQPALLTAGASPACMPRARLASGRSRRARARSCPRSRSVRARVEVRVPDQRAGEGPSVPPVVRLLDVVRQVLGRSARDGGRAHLGSPDPLVAVAVSGHHVVQLRRDVDEGPGAGTARMLLGQGRIRIRVIADRLRLDRWSGWSRVRAPVHEHQRADGDGERERQHDGPCHPGWHGGRAYEFGGRSSARASGANGTGVR